MRRGEGQTRADGRVLVIGRDHERVTDLLVDLKRKGYAVAKAGTGRQALAKARRGSYELALLNQEVSGIDVMELAAALKELQPEMTVVEIGAGASVGGPARAANGTSSACVLTPVSIQAVLQPVDGVVQGRHHGVGIAGWHQAAGHDPTQLEPPEEASSGSEARYRSLVDTAGAGIGITDLNGVFVFVNRALCRVLRYSRQALLGRRFFDFLHPDDREGILRAFLKGLEGQRSHPLLEFRVIRGDGHTVWLCSSPTALTHENKTIGFSAILQDITERKQVEEALRRSEEKYRHLVEDMQDGYLVVRGSRVLLANRVIAEVLGLNAEEITDASLLHRLTPESRAKSRQIYRRTRRREPPPDVECFELQLADGSTMPVEMRFKEIAYEGERAYSILVRDITERRRAEEELLVSEEKYRNLVEEICDGYLVVRGSRILLANRMISEVLGGSVAGVAGASYLHHLTPESREKSRQLYERTRCGEPPPDVECFELQRADGSAMPVEMRFKEITYEGEKAYSILLRDITERKRAEEALQEGERRYRLLAENATDVIWTMDMDLRFTYVSPSVTRLQGYTVEEAMALTTDRLFTPSSLRIARNVLREERAVQRRRGRDPSGSRALELELYRKDGSTVWTEVTVTFLRDEADKAIGILGIARDITERKQAREALEDSERKYRNLVERANDGILVILDGVIVFSNERLVDMTGYTLEDLLGKSYADFLHPDEVATLVDRYRRRMNGEDVPALYEAVLKRKDGTDVHVEINAGAFRYQGQPADFVFVRDITERKRAEEEIRRHTRRVEALHAIGQTVSQTLDLNELLEKALARVLEVTDSDAGGIYLLEPEGGELVLKANRGVREEYTRAVGTIALDDEGRQQGLVSDGVALALDEALRRAGMVAEADRMVAEGLLSSIGVPFWSKGTPQGVLVVARRTPTDFTEEEIELVRAVGSEIGVGVENARLLERMTELSVTDELTGLFNRRHFYEVLEAEISRTRRYGRSFSLVMLDLDGLKEYNDRFGHISGDTLLCSLADTLRSSLRKSDTGFRYSGDKFTVILPAADSAKATRVVNRVRSRWLRCAKPEGFAPDTPLGFSAGIAEFPADAGTADGLVFLADTAVFHSRRQGGYRTTLVSELGTVTLSSMDDAVLDHVYALAATVDARDPHTYGHSERVAAIAESIGTALGLSSEEVLNVHAAGLLHDIGKIGVPDSILTKPGGLTEEEREMIERHPVEGARIVGHIKELTALVPIVRHHHEWYDGTGYPDGLKGKDIPLGARIVAIADAYDTMTTTRPYRTKISRGEALEELKRCAGVQFDPDLVETFESVIEEGRISKIGVGG